MKLGDSIFRIQTSWQETLKPVQMGQVIGSFLIWSGWRHACLATIMMMAHASQRKLYDQLLLDMGGENQVEDRHYHLFYLLFYPSTWLSYLMDFLSLRLFEAAGDKGYNLAAGARHYQDLSLESFTRGVIPLSLIRPPEVVRMYIVVSTNTWPCIHTNKELEQKLTNIGV